MYKIIGVTPGVLHIEITDVDGYDAQDETEKLSIGSHLKISDDKGLSIIAIAQSFRVKDQVQESGQVAPRRASFVIEAQQVGCFEAGRFRRGGQQIAIPPTKVEVASAADLDLIYSGVAPGKRFSFGRMAQNAAIRVVLDGDRFFGKHIGVVGSTGSGKSCTVAKVIQEGIRPTGEQNSNGVLNNAHVIIFDLHGEYAPAFPKASRIDIENLALPYWLMNSEELEELFIESQEQNSHNQVSQFKLAVTENKRRHNPELTKVTYDTPAYFSIREVYRYIRNQNVATKDAKTRELAIKDRPGGTDDRQLLFEEIAFEEKATGKINDGPYAGEFDRFVGRLETKLNDRRLDFLLCPESSPNAAYRTGDLPSLLKQFTGYVESSEANVTIIDLSGIPFEVCNPFAFLDTPAMFWRGTMQSKRATPCPNPPSGPAAPLPPRSRPRSSCRC